MSVFTPEQEARLREIVGETLGYISFPSVLQMDEGDGGSAQKLSAEESAVCQRPHGDRA